MGKSDQSVKSAKGMYFISLLPFFLFLVNVLSGAYLNKPFLSDVMEMVTLLLTSVGFVIIVLKEESKLAFKKKSARSEQ